MSDEKPENQEYFKTPELNDFHSSADARVFSASSENTEETVEKTVSSSLPATAGVLTTGAVATAAVTIGVLVSKPLLNNLPKIDLLEANATSTSVSYSFECTYVAAGNLTVKLASALEEKSTSYPLEVSETSSSSASVSVTDSSVASSSSESSVSYKKTIQGTFAELSPSTTYALTILSPLTGNTLTTLKTETVATSSNPLKQGSLSFSQAKIDNATKRFTYQVSLNDPSSVLDPTSYTLLVSGADLSGTTTTLKESIASLSNPTSVSLSSFRGSQSLSFTLAAISSYVKEGASPVSALQNFDSTSLYYAGIAPSASFSSSAVDNTAKSFSYQIALSDECGLLDKTSLSLEVSGLSLAGGALTESHPYDSTSSGTQSVSLASFKGSESLTFVLKGISFYALQDASVSKEPVVLATTTAYYAGSQATIAFLTSTVDYTSLSLSYSLSVSDPTAVLSNDLTSFFIQAIGVDSTGSSKTVKGAFTGSLTDVQTLSLSGFTKGNFLRLSIWGISSYALEGDTAPSTAQKFVEKALYY